MLFLSKVIFQMGIHEYGYSHMGGLVADLHVKGKSIPGIDSSS